MVIGMVAVVVKLEFVVGEVEFIVEEVMLVIEIHRMKFVVVEIECVKHMTDVQMKIANQLMYLEFERMMMRV